MQKIGWFWSCESSSEAVSYTHLDVYKRQNNTNIIAFGARVIGVETAKMIVDEWLNAEYEGGRHQVRVDMIAEIENTGHLQAAEE